MPITVSDSSRPLSNAARHEPKRNRADDARDAPATAPPAIDHSQRADASARRMTQTECDDVEDRQDAAVCVSNGTGAGAGRIPSRIAQDRARLLVALSVVQSPERFAVPSSCSETAAS